MEKFWYVIQSHPNKEQMLFKQLELLEIEVFFPRIRVKPVNPRARKIRPYFPGYIFIQSDPETIDTSALKWIPHSVLEYKEEIQSGAPVLIEYGPFEGYEGIFDTRLAGSDRARILLKMLSDNYIPVELEISQIQKKKK